MRLAPFLAVLAAAAAAAAASAQPLPPTLAALPAEPLDASTLRFSPPDRAVAAALRPVLVAARADVGAFFGAPFPEPVHAAVVPDRAAFTAVMHEAWGVPETACWMVALGVADYLVVLSPRAWPADACEHDPTDAPHLRDLVAHELVHVYHGQHNPTRDFTGMDDVGWFVEGVATLAAGQLTDDRLARLREALAAGEGPARLAEAWSGPHRYAVAGSMTRVVDEALGRAALLHLLAATTQAELLAALGTTESDFLARWRASVLATGAPQR